MHAGGLGTWDQRRQDELYGLPGDVQPEPGQTLYDHAISEDVSARQRRIPADASLINLRLLGYRSAQTNPASQSLRFPFRPAPHSGIRAGLYWKSF